MALKQLLLGKKIEQRQSALTELLTQGEALKTRAADLEASLGEVQNDEEMKVVEGEIEKLDGEQKEHDEKKGQLEREIAELEGELQQINSKTPNNQKRSDNKEGNDNMNKFQVRELIRSGEYYKRSEVVEFYEQFKNLRAVTGGELTIPEVVVNRIMDIMGDFTTLYPLVDKIRVKGTTRILIDTDTTAATWIEQSGTLATGDVGTITNIDFDGYKVGKVAFVDNYLLQDSIVNLDDYVSKKIARAIAKALDAAILNGTGAAGKQPTGIIPNVPAGNKADVTINADLIKNLVKKIGLVDTGEDSVGEIVAVMKRTTYYNRLVEYSIQVDASGNVVGKLPNLKSPDLVGLTVVFNNNMAEDKVLFGDMSQYTLVERESISIDSSSHVKFSEDQTGFRGKGRFDGKPTKAKAFALISLVAGA